MSGTDEPFAVTATSGFLPIRDPLRRLPPQYEELEDLVDEIPKLLACSSGVLRQAVEHRLPSLLVPSLSSLLKALRPYEAERMLLVVSFLAHAYVWGRPNDEKPATSLPHCLATLWIEIAELRGRPPILAYASFNLYNWRRIDPTKPVALGNICCLNNFLGGLDEEWFRLVHIEIEAIAAPAIGHLLRYMETRHRKGLIEALEAITSCLEAVQRSLGRMGEGCDPSIYYARVRQYMSGWRSNPKLPDGLMYGRHGLKEFYGETGAQSGIIPAFDAFLGVTHEMNAMREYLLEMRSYMPLPHQAFVDRLDGLSPPIRDLVAEDDSLVGPYDAAVTALARFRARHLGYADRYIRQPSRKERDKEKQQQQQQQQQQEAREKERNKDEEEEDEGEDDDGLAAASEGGRSVLQQQRQQQEGEEAETVGTGGTDFTSYLKVHHDETKKQLLGSDREKKNHLL